MSLLVGISIKFNLKTGINFLFVSIFLSDIIYNER